MLLEVLYRMININYFFSEHWSVWNILLTVNTVPLRPFVGDVDRFVGDFGNGSDFSSASSFPISRFSSSSFFSVSSSAFSFSSGSGLSSVFVSAASVVSSSSAFSFSPSSFFSS